MLITGSPALAKRGLDGHNAGGVNTGSDIPVEQPGRRRMQKLFRRAQSSLDPRRRAVERDRLSAGSDGGKRDLDTYSSSSSIEGTPPRPIPRGPTVTGTKRQYDQMGRGDRSSDRISGTSGPESMESSLHSEFGGLGLAGQGALMVTPSKESTSEETGSGTEKISEPTTKSELKSRQSANSEDSGGLIFGLVASNANYQGPPTPSSEPRERHTSDASIMSLTKMKPVTIASFKPIFPYPGSEPVPSSHSRSSSSDTRQSPKDVHATDKQQTILPPEEYLSSNKQSKVLCESNMKDTSADSQKSPDLAEVLDLIDVHFSMAHQNEPDTSDTSNITSPEVLANLTSGKSERSPSFVQPGILTTENGAVLNISPRSRSRLHKQDSPKVRKVIKADLIDFDRESPSPEKDELARNLKSEFDELFPQERSQSVKNHAGVASGASSILSTPDDVFAATISILNKGHSSMESSYISALESRPETETKTDDLTTPDSLSSPDKTFINGSSPSSKAMQSSLSPNTPGMQKTGVSPRSHKPVKAEYSVSTTSRVLGADAGRRSRQTSVSDQPKLLDRDMVQSMIETKQESGTVVTKHSISYESGLETIGGIDSSLRQKADSTEFITSVKDMCLDFSRKLGLNGGDSLETESTTDSGIVRDQSDKPFFYENSEKFRSISVKDFSRKFNTWTGVGARQKQRRSLGGEQVCV